MSDKTSIIIPGMENLSRLDSRVLEERVHQAIGEGYRDIEVIAHGQHGIGGRIWQAGREPVRIRVTGMSGQRLGAMGFPQTLIECVGSASDDVGWLNAGAEIVVRGDVTNGAGNAMAQGKIFIAGDTGARAMTMTKHNPRFAPPEMWVLGTVGDSFAEFMAGGIAVICGHGSLRKKNVLGYRPCVGMVGGKIFFRGPHQGFSDQDARLTVPDDGEWLWLITGLEDFLARIEQVELYPRLTADRGAWKILVARKPYEKVGGPVRKMSAFRKEVWDKNLGPGGLIGDLTQMDMSPVEVITRGDLRRYIPLWENGKYVAPCQAHCPTGIPVQKRWELIRKGAMVEAVDLALNYTPFPATVCGYLCPNLCMDHCTRQSINWPAVDITQLGKSSLHAQPPARAPETGKKIAIIGGGAAGLSVAWQLWLKGHEPFVFDYREHLGGKITETIPESRIPAEVVAHELKRLSDRIKWVHLPSLLEQEDFQKIRDEYDFVVIAAGAQQPRMLNVAGSERAVSALEFLRQARKNAAAPGERVVVIGAGNVGCDAAAEAHRLGAKEVTLIDIQEPASFGKERKAAEQAGARFLWPRFTRAITEEGVALTSGETLPADTVIVAIGDEPALDFLSDDIRTEKGFIAVDERFRTTDPRVFAIGDVVRLGLLTEAIGAGCTAARTIDDLLKGREETYDHLPVIDPERIRLEYYEPETKAADSPAACACQCASCGACRDCGLCTTLCPEQAISRNPAEGPSYEYVVDENRCIGCGFCAGACPCGIWRLVENEPLD
jgi:NADPH-dependent glutamate synthase beta subunit-like oxidoreductase/ferredoxin